jgi:hypothetical protein
MPARLDPRALGFSRAARRACGRGEQVTERLDRLTELVAQTNTEVDAERRRLGDAEQQKQRQQDADLARVLRDVDAMEE